MFTPDFFDRTYTVEVLKTRSEGADVFNSAVRLTTEPEMGDYESETRGSVIRVCHAFVASESSYHRFAKTIKSANGEERTIPRSVKIRGRTNYLYDVFVAQSLRHVIVAVPFHELAEQFFPRVDNRLGGTGTRYEKLNITQMVIQLGASGSTTLSTTAKGEATSLVVTRCHLAYADQSGRTSNIQQVRVTGANLGASSEYQTLIEPVLAPETSPLTVTPIILGFALLSDGVRKSTATTDRHGNFKLWIAPGLRRLLRLFDLLASLETMKDVTSTTSNIPIMQSKTIRDAED